MLKFSMLLVLLRASFVRSLDYDATPPLRSLPRCDMTIVETLPESMTYDNSLFMTPSIASVWTTMINSYKKKLHITSFYWSMLNNDVSKEYFPSSKIGENIFKQMKAKSLKYPLEIIVNKGNGSNDLKILRNNSKLVQVHELDVPRLLNAGVQHSKVWIADNSSAFVGSPNMDWRAVAQIKELGVFLPACGQIAADLDLFWQALRLLSGPNSSLPPRWPVNLSPRYNISSPFQASVNGVPSRIYVATSPPAFNPPHRTDDLTGLLDVINRAQKFVCISVMDFWPLSLKYGKHSGNPSYWPKIQDSLVAAAEERGVIVKLLISYWQHTNRKMLRYLAALGNLSKIPGIDIQIRIFVVPAFNPAQTRIPFSRVSHSKYMVTETTAYVGTSNWSGDYFTNTGGASVIVQETQRSSNSSKSVRTQLERVFNSDWYSIYAHDLYDW